MADHLEAHAAADEPLAIVLSRGGGALIKLISAAGAVVTLSIGVISLLPMGQRLVEPSASLYVLLVAGLLLAAATFAVPWEQLGVRQAQRALTAMMAVGVLIVGALVSHTGGASSDQLWSVLLITLFAASVMPPWHQFGIFLLTVAAYISGSLAAGSVNTGAAIYRVAVLAAVTLTAGYLAGMLRRTLAERDAAVRAAEDHADRFEVVAHGVRSTATTDPDEVVAAVAQTVRALGWRDVAIFVSTERGRVDLAAWEGATDDPPAGALALTAEWATEVLANGGTLTLADVRTHPRLGHAAETFDVASAIGCPFLADGEPAGVVLAATPMPHRFSPADVESFELVASCAGRALELARRYADERERVAELRELDRVRSEFLSTVSHELRTPLTVILGLSETIDRAWDVLPDARKRELLDRVRDNAGGLDRVIATLLDFTRLEQGHLETRLETFDLGDLIHTVTVRLGSLLEHHALVVDVPRSLPAYGDDRLLERVIENLLSNVQRHTPPGTTVTVRAEVHARSIEVAVADDGPGIAEGDLAHLGERFYRGGDPGTRTTRGVGLGLALTREVLRLHDSRLRIESVVGEGTTFAFALPIPLRHAGVNAPVGTTGSAS